MLGWLHTNPHTCGVLSKQSKGGGEGTNSGANSSSGRDGATASEWRDVARDGFVGAVGKTPLIRLRGPSEETGCEILAKVHAHSCTLQHAWHEYFIATHAGRA